MIVTLAGPAAAVAHTPAQQRAAFAVPRPAPPLRDVVHAAPSAAAARISASAEGERYPLNDGSDDSIEVVVTADCQRQCDAADPQAIADFIGTLIHGPEV